MKNDINEKLKNFLISNYYLRCESMSFLILVKKSDGGFTNLYSRDTKESREYLKDIARSMEKHPKILED